MSRLTGIEKAIRDLESSIAGTEVAVGLLSEKIIPFRQESAKMLSPVLDSASQALERFSDQKRTLLHYQAKVVEEIGNVKGLIARAADMNEPVLGRERQRLIDLRELLRDLLSDLECLENVKANIEGRLTRLKGGV